MKITIKSKEVTLAKSCCASLRLDGSQSASVAVFGYVTLKAYHFKCLYNKNISFVRMLIGIVSFSPSCFTQIKNSFSASVIKVINYNSRNYELKQTKFTADLESIDDVSNLRK